MSAFTLKIIATALMIIDHVAEFIPIMPVQLHWIGRLSSPIFLFLCGWSCEYTHNRRNYLLRLYIAGLIMSVPQGLLELSNNIFPTLFHVAFIITLLKTGDVKTRVRNIALYIAYQCVLTAVLLSDSLFFFYEDVPALPRTVILNMLGSITIIEGGLIYVIIGVGLWITRNNAIALSATYLGINAVFSLLLSSWGAKAMTFVEHSIILSFPSEALIQDNNIAMDLIMNIHAVLEIFGIDFFNMGASPLSINYQWMMIFALPLMLIYNHQRGHNVKWFFYWFYPVHILVLYGLGTALGFSVDMS